MEFWPSQDKICFDVWLSGAQAAVQIQWQQIVKLICTKYLNDTTMTSLSLARSNVQNMSPNGDSQAPTCSSVEKLKSTKKENMKVCLTLGWSSVVFAYRKKQPIVPLRWSIVTLRWPIVTLRWPLVTLHTSPYPNLPHLATASPLVKQN